MLLVSISVEEAARDLGRHVDRVARRLEPIVITRGGEPVAVLAPVERVRVKDLSELFARFPELSREEAEELARDLEAARDELENGALRDPRAC